MSINHYINAAKLDIENKDISTIERFKEEVRRQPDLIACLRIHLKYEILKWEAEQEFIADFLENWDAERIDDASASVEPVPGAVLLGALRRFQSYQRMEEMPDAIGGGIGYFAECDQDRDRELASFHRSSSGFAWSARIAQANIDKPPKAPFGEMGPSYAEQNAEACRTLLTYADR